MSDSERLSQSALIRLNAMIDELKHHGSESFGFDYQKDLDACLELLQGAGPGRLESYGINTAYDEQQTTNGEGAASWDSSNRFTDPTLIGVGAYAMVFRVFDGALKIPVALKLLKPSKAGSTEYQARFLGEAHSTAQLSHPGIIRIFDTGRICSIPFMTCEYASTGSLGDWLRENPKPMDQIHAATLMAQVAEAVQYAHSKLRLHRDIKPGNILLFEQVASSTNQIRRTVVRSHPSFSYVPVLADFGLSKQIGSVPSEWTTEGSIVGTARYMSPEQASGCIEDLRTTTDVYSMGVVLYQLLTGRVPFDAEFEAQIRSMVRGGAVRRASVYRPDLSKDLEAVVMKCLAKDPEQRYQTARELHADLQCFIGGQNVAARKLSLVRSTARIIKRHPVTSTLVALLIATNFSALALVNKSRNDAVRASNETIRVIGKLHNGFGDEVIERTLISPAEYQEKLSESIAFIEEWMGKYGESESAIHTLSVLRHYSSLCHYLLGQSEEGIHDRMKVIESQRRLLASEPENRKLRFQMATSLLHLATGLSFIDSSRNQQIIETLDMARQEVEQLSQGASRDEQQSYYIESIDLANAIDRQKAEILRVDDPQGALVLLERARRSAVDLAIRYPAQPMLLSHAVFALWTESKIYEEQEEIDKSSAKYRDAEELSLMHWEGHWEKGWTTTKVTEIYFEWYVLLNRAERYEEALDVLDRWRDFHRRTFPHATGDVFDHILRDKFTIDYSILCFKRHSLMMVQHVTELEDEGLKWDLVGAAGRIELDERGMLQLQKAIGRYGACSQELTDVLAQGQYDRQESGQ